jgi:hypothetical protein
MASHQTFGQRGKILHSQAREIIANVIAFMKHESECVRNNRELTIPIINYKQRVMASTGISEKMYKTITKEHKLYQYYKIIMLNFSLKSVKNPLFIIIDYIINCLKRFILLG